MPRPDDDIDLFQSSPSGSYETFFATMEDVGFFEHIYENLPEGFTALFEIARILEDPEHPLTRKLEPAFALRAAAARAGEVRPAPEEETIIPTGEEYEAQLLRSWHDIPRIYTAQWLLPEEIFLRRVAERSLWAPYAKEPTWRAISSNPEDYSPDSRKQKVYILLDTSSSMGTKNRIHLAKAIVYHFLRRNLREMGDISFRTFDVSVGELHEARDRESFHALISHVMRLHTLGNGTAMAKAIEQAVRDIRELPRFAGTEILIVSDGACTLDEARMRELMADDIRIHTVKIGRMQIFPARSYIEDLIARGDTPKRRRLVQLRQSAAELRRDVAIAAGPAHRHKAESSLAFVEAEIRRLEAEIAGEVTAEYAHELERLSTVYVNVEDVESADLFSVDPERIGELEELLGKIMEELRENFTLEKLKQAALLDDHIAFLLKFVREPRMKQALTALEKKIEEMLKTSVEENLNSIGSSAMAGVTSEDRHDVEYLLAQTIGAHISIWKILLWKLASRLRRMVRRS